VVGCCECRDEPSCSCATELVRKFFCSVPSSGLEAVDGRAENQAHHREASCFCVPWPMFTGCTRLLNAGGNNIAVCVYL
jgi:hypothetical protein